MKQLQFTANLFNCTKYSNIELNFKIDATRKINHLFSILIIRKTFIKHYT